MTIQLLSCNKEFSTPRTLYLCDAIFWLDFLRCILWLYIKKAQITIIESSQLWDVDIGRKEFFCFKLDEKTQTYPNQASFFWSHCLLDFVEVPAWLNLNLYKKKKCTTKWVTSTWLNCMSVKMKISHFQKLPFLGLLPVAAKEPAWGVCELGRFASFWLGWDEYRAGLWTLDRVTMLLLICWTWGLWTTPGNTAEACCCPAGRQNKPLCLLVLLIEWSPEN